MECLTFLNQMINQWHRFSHVFCVWNFKAQLLGDGGTGEGALFGHPKRQHNLSNAHLCTCVMIMVTITVGFKRKCGDNLQNWQK